MNRNNLVRTVTGVVILLAGVGLLLNNTGVVDFKAVVNDWWPMLIVVAGLLVFANSRNSWLPALFLIALGGLYQLRVLDIISFEPWAVIWPLFVALIGLSMVFRRSYTGKQVSQSERETISAILAGADVKSSSKSFKRSDITAIMGGAKLDLRAAKIGEDAVVTVSTFWGGVEIIVPEDVEVRNRVNSIMSGVENKTDQKPSEDAPIITIAGDAIMSGVSIRNRPSDS